MVWKKSRLQQAFEIEIKQHQLNVTAILVFDSLVRLILPEGPLKGRPKPIYICETDLAFMVKRDPRQIRYALEDLLRANLIDRVPVSETDSSNQLKFSKNCFDITPFLQRYELLPKS